MPIFGLNHTLRTSEEWRERLAKLQGEAAEAERDLETARQARKEADLASVLSGKPANGLTKLEAEESKATRRVTALAAAMEMAQAQLTKAQETERIAEQRRLGDLRGQLRQEIVQHAAQLDAAFREASARLSAIDGLLREFQHAGGRQVRPLKWLAGYAAKKAGLHSFLDLSVVGGPHHHRALQEQLERLLAEAAQPPQEKSA